jgi:hypothetical protein
MISVCSCGARKNMIVIRVQAYSRYREFLQNLQRNVPVGSRNPRLGDHSIGANQPEKEGGFGWR